MFFYSVILKKDDLLFFLARARVRDGQKRSM